MQEDETMRATFLSYEHCIKVTHRGMIEPFFRMISLFNAAFLQPLFCHLIHHVMWFFSRIEEISIIMESHDQFEK